MADKPSSSPAQDLFFFLTLIAGLFILWLAGGGPDREQTDGFLINNINPRTELRDARDIVVDRGMPTRREVEETISDVQEKLQRVQEELQQARLQGVGSPYEGLVEIRGGRGRERFAHTEYIELAARRGNTVDVEITGWVLESVVTGQRGVIGGATNLPFPGSVNTERALLLTPGERAIIVTGRSPIGASFRTNTCVGYFEQFQDFSPRLRRDCADPVDEFDEFAPLPVTNVRFEDDKREICRAFIDRNINRCEINRVKLSDTELRLTDECQAFIETTYTYSGCVANHRFDSDFLGDTWYVFLGSPAELWREKREIIRLLDQEGRVVDIFDY